MTSAATVTAAALLGAAAIACHSPTPSHQPATTEVRSSGLEPWEPAEETFRGCEGACGARVASPVEGAAVQPGASIGDRTYCLVSGVVFQVQEASAHRTVGGATIYMCCAVCAEFFSANRDRILEQRGLPPPR